jgi:hypothetical protein
MMVTPMKMMMMRRGEVTAQQSARTVRDPAG